jgi:hypothetical protein
MKKRKKIFSKKFGKEFTFDIFVKLSQKRSFLLKKFRLDCFDVALLMHDSKKVPYKS